MKKTLKPLLIVISAPSGAGKSTLCSRLLAEFNDVVYSISCTTRAPRGAEIDGKDYLFLSDEVFDRRVQEGAFLEHAVVHGYKYGTLKLTVYGELSIGKSVLMDIDVQGAAQIREYVSKAPADDLLKKGFIDIFISPPSINVLKERLKNRAEDADEIIEQRLNNAEAEMADRNLFKYQIVNDKVDKAYAELVSILDGEKSAATG